MLLTYCYKLLRKQVLMKRFEYLNLSHGIEFRCCIQYLKTKCTQYDTVGCDNMNSIVIQFCNILLLFSIESYGSHLTNQHVIDNSIVLMIIVFLFFICSILMLIFFNSWYIFAAISLTGILLFLAIFFLFGRTLTQIIKFFSRVCYPCL